MTTVAPVRTVSGDELAADYDTVLAHEHLRIDIRCWFAEKSEHAPRLRDLVVTPETAPQVQRDPFACLDNLVLDDRELITDELRHLEGDGRTLVVDVTPENVGRDLAYLRWVSDRSSVDIVHGCGLYISESRPGEVVGPPEGYRDAILAQFADHGRRPAVIGEIGSGDPITPLERASLIGAAMAQAELGVPLYVHLHPWARRGLEILNLIAEHGADLQRTVLCHLDTQIPAGLDYHRELLRRGCRIAFDIWGDEFPYGDLGMPTDNERLEATLRLIDEGFGDRLVHSHDVCTKTQLRRFGGVGFSHLSGAVRAKMREAGLDEAEARRQLAGNALDLLRGDGRGGDRPEAGAAERRGDV